MFKLIKDLLSVLFSRSFFRIPSYTRCFRRLLQRYKYGCDERDLWNLDYTITEFITPRLKMFRERNRCFPSYMTLEEWNAILDKMIYGFENYEDDSEASKQAFELLAKYYVHLWE